MHWQRLHHEGGHVFVVFYSYYILKFFIYTLLEHILGFSFDGMQVGVSGEPSLS